MVSGIFNNLINFIGVAFIGRLHDPDQLAACGIAALVYLVMAMIPYGFSVGFQVIIARRAGENDSRAIGIVFDNNFLFMTCLSVLMFFFLKFGVPVFLKPLFQSQAIYEDGMRYLGYRAYEVFFTVLAFTLAAYYTSIGKTKIIIWSACMMLLINISMSYTLIFGKFGAPEMGIGGAGLASLIATSSASLVNLAYLWFSKFRKQFELFVFHSLHWDYVRKAFRLSGPVVLQHLLSSASWLIFFLFIEKTGERPSAASAVIKEVYMLFAVSTWGLANATNAMVSNVLGQQLHDEIPKLLRKIINLSNIFSVAFASLLFAVPDLFIRIFTTDQEIITLATNPVRVVGVALILMSVASVLFRAITGTGATRYSLIAEFITIVIYMIYITLLIPVWHASLAMAWTSEWMYWIVLGSLCFLYLRSGRWKSHSV